MPTDAATGRLWVLSDLHLAPAGDQCVFRAHAALTSFIDHLSTLPMADPPQWLVLNGDVFETWKKDIAGNNRTADQKWSAIRSTAIDKL